MLCCFVFFVFVFFFFKKRGKTNFLSQKRVVFFNNSGLHDSRRHIDFDFFFLLLFRIIMSQTQVDMVETIQIARGGDNVNEINAK